jgi:drug/metabolite transporter superfamily protein YnfA
MVGILAGLLLWILLAAMAWKCSAEWQTLDRYDRIGSIVFFTVVGLPLFIAALGMLVPAMKT